MFSFCWGVCGLDDVMFYNDDVSVEEGDEFGWGVVLLV